MKQLSSLMKVKYESRLRGLQQRISNLLVADEECRCPAHAEQLEALDEAYYKLLGGVCSCDECIGKG